MKKQTYGVAVFFIALFVLIGAHAAKAGNPGNCQQFDGSGEAGQINATYSCGGLPPIEGIGTILTANPTTIVQGQGSTLSWGAVYFGNGGASCYSSQFDTGGASSGSVVVYPNVSTTYTVTCSGTYVSHAWSAAVNVNAAYTDVYAGATSPSSAVLGQAVTFSSSVTNQGNATATNFPNVFQISGIGYVAAQTHTLGAGGSAGISGSYTFNSAGSYSVRACADTNTSGAGALSESDEGNNCGAWQTVTVSAPDLTAAATSYTADPSSPYVIEGQPYTFNSSVSNVGNATATNFPNMFHISGVTLFQAQTHTLGAGGSAAISGSYTFSTPGTYSVQSCADYNYTNWGTVIPESNEGNNCGSWLGIFVVPRAPTGVTASCNANGTQATLSWNAPSGASAYYVRVQVPGTTCPSGWQYAGNNICVPNPDWVTGTSIVFPTAPSTAYSFGVHGAISNGAWGPSSWTGFSCTGQVDLTASSMTPTVVAGGQSATFSATITNSGNIATAGSFPNTLWFDTDLNLSNGNLGNVQAWRTTSLGAGSSAVVSGAWTPPLASGTYYGIACADNDASWASLVVESNDGNNCGAWTAITVTAPDLTAGAPSPASAVQGVPVTISGPVNNIGTAASGVSTNSNVRIFNSSGTLIYQDGFTTPSIAGGGNTTASYLYTFSAAGNYTAQICADWNGVVSESNEGNNCGASTAITVTAPDLTAGTTSVVPSGGDTYPYSGIPFTLNSTVSNAGNATATNFPNMFHNSGVTLYGAQTHTLAGGGSAAISSTVTINTPGIYSIQSCADYNTSWGTAIPESNEGNNCGAFATVSVTPLAPTGLTATCNANGTSATLSWNASSGASAYYVRVNKNGTCPSGWQQPGWDANSCVPNPDWVTGTSIVFPMTPGATHSFGIHSALSNGAWGRASGSSFTCAGAPDLTAGTISPTTAVAGASQTYSVSVTNGGNASTGTSFTNLFQIRNAGDVQIDSGTVAASAIGAGSSQMVSFARTITTGGTYTIRLCADADGAMAGTISESNEGNNCGPWTTVTVTAPDLTASNLGPATASMGSPATFSGRVNNVGNATANNIPNIFQICDASCTGLNTLITGTTITSVAAGASNSGVTGTYTFSSPGTYLYRMCADTNGVWVGTNAESNEGNNCDAFSSVTVTAADLTGVTGGPASGTVGSPVTLSGTITNNGNGTAPGHSSVIQICGNGTDASCTTVQANTQVAVGALTASQSAPVSTQFTFLASGTNGYSYRVCADNWSPTVTESNEGNNCGAWSYVSINDPSIVASCSVSPTAQQLNQNVTWTASASGGNGSFTYSWSGTAPLSGTGNPRTVAYSSSGTKTGSVTVTSGGQNVTVPCSNSVVVSDPPGTTLSSSPTIVTTGSASTLTWSSTGATSCTGTGFNTGGATSGSVSTGPLTSTQNYQVSCTGAGGTTNDFETVTVIAPTANITAQPTLVRSGQGTNLVWSAAEVSSCTLSSNQAGPSIAQTTYAPVPAGSITTAVTNITRQTDFTLSCTTLSGENLSGSVQVNVRFDSDEF